ncbi:envelope biogenesis factor ElyC [Desulfohalobiaceae bacterium Ax17]|uniref:envelope biogenesis factor ElyC n=1 Tax=Desulfovulcanus ferrireducens TaxID=2831190 RepID=UPI00207BC982|nr:envelope biogenesis factor ElyC [Desulfovulcanus ferrireducens]MBT8763440.1 envelope biogenesis factor ElyC [Desulfovulcanus ferrireducens]
MFKKIVSRLLFPLPLCVEILGLGLLCLLFNKKRAGKIFIFVGLSLLTAMSVGPVADKLLSPLEHKYRPLQEVPEGVEFIVVLGGGHDSDPALPPNSQIGRSALARVVEALRLKNKLPKAKIIFSGGRLNDPQSNALVMARVARILGLKEQDIILEIESKDTKDEARLLKNMLQNKSFVLVTSASHMHRSMLLFQAQGLNPIPSPTDYLAKEKKRYNLWDYFPSSDGLEKMERVFYEYLGMAWARLRGQI